MFMFKSRTAARKFKNGRNGYIVKDLGSNAGEYRWSVKVPNDNVGNRQVFVS